MIFPKFISEGDTIGFIAPSFGASTEPYISTFNAALSHFKEQGFKTVEGPNAREGSGIGISSSPEKCAAEVNEFFGRDDIDAIISCGGGELMMGILPYIDWEKLKSDCTRNPKWFMGYSDNTNLILPMVTMCDTAAVYGPCASAFGMEKWEPSIFDALEMLKGERMEIKGYEWFELESLKSPENPYAGYNLTEKKVLRFPMGDKNVSMKGRLIGGCLDCLTVLCGTKFDRVKEYVERYKDDGIIWFLECCDLNPMSLRRAIWNLDQAGWFENVTGFVIGRSLHYGEEFMGLDMYSAYTGVLEKYNVPIVMDADIGHLSPMMPVIAGAVARVTADEKNICFNYENFQ